MKKQFLFFCLQILMVGIITWLLLNFSSGKITIEQAITIGLLAITGIFVWSQSWETRRMAEYQLMPAVDVNMHYDKIINKTYLWFYNSSNFPVFISILVRTHSLERIELRLPPKKDPYWIRKTATHYDFPKCELTLDVTVSPDITDNKVKFNFKKSYVFDFKELQWLESTWAFPDDPYPIITS